MAKTLPLEDHDNPEVIMFDVTKLKQEAEAELAEERAKEIKAWLKKLLKDRDTAQEVVNNLNREIELLVAEQGGK